MECLNLLPDFKPVTKWMMMTKRIQLQIPTDIYELYATSCESSPWSFVLSLVYEFGADFCPKQTYFKLKLGLLLSLVSLSGSHKDDDWILPVMAVAYDTTISQRLMAYAGQNLAESPHFPNKQLSSSSYELRIGSDLIKIRDAGSVLLHSGGVCDLGELQTTRKCDLYTLKTIWRLVGFPLTS